MDLLDIRSRCRQTFVSLCLRPLQLLHSGTYLFLACEQLLERSDVESP